MNKWTKDAKARLVEIQEDQACAADMRAIVAAFAKLPKGQLKKVLTEEIIGILAKYGVAFDGN